MRWILVEATERVLPEIDLSLADYALRELRGRGIEIRLGTTLEGVEADSATLSTGETVPTRTVVWTAGVRPHPSLRNLSVPLDERGRVKVDDHLRVEGQEGVWAIGDCAAVPDPGGRARAADRPARDPPGRVVAANVAGALAASRRGATATRAAPPSSTSAATRRSAGSAAGPFSGFLAWWLARTYHLSQIPGAFRKLRAVIDWTVSLPFAARHLRGRLDRPPAPAPRRGVRARRLPPAARLASAER